MQIDWPIPTESVSSAAVGTVLWRHVGRTNLTVVMKATMSLEDGLARTLPPGEIVLAERFGRGTRGLVLDADVAPHKPRAEVLFVGHACSSQPVAMLNVRLGVRGDSSFMEKSLSVVGDRAAQHAPPQPFRKLPIAWDRACAEPNLNPIGVTAGSGRLPNIYYSDDGSAPAGFGPIARSWPSRQRFVGRNDPSRLEGVRPDMPNDLSWGFFLAAPQDQQLAPLKGNETILLENLIEGRPLVRSQLPGAKAVARIFGPTTGPEGQPVELKLDTLTIDGDRQCVHLTWRGTVPSFNEAHAAQCRVVGGLDTPTNAAKLTPRGGVPATAPPATERLGPAHVGGAGLPPTGPLPPGMPGTGPLPPAPHGPATGPLPPPPGGDSHTEVLGRQLLNLPVPSPGEDHGPDSGSSGSTMAIDPDAAMRMIANARAAMPFGGPPIPGGGPPPAPPPPAPYAAAPVAPAPFGRTPQPGMTHPIPPNMMSPSPQAQGTPAQPSRFSAAGLIHGHAPAGQPLGPAPVVVRAAGHYDMDDDDSVGSTMAITPEAAAELMARRAAGAPPVSGPPATVPLQGPPLQSPPLQAPPVVAHHPAPTRPGKTAPPNLPPPAPPPPMPPELPRHGTMEMGQINERPAPPGQAPPAPIDDPETDGGGTMVLIDGVFPPRR